MGLGLIVRSEYTKLGSVFLRWSEVRLRIGCSTTELPRPALLTIAVAEIFCQFNRESCVPSSREGIHRPADTHPDQQEKEERPHDIFHTLDGLSAAQEAERYRYRQREQQHGLQMTQVEDDR